MTDDLKEGEIRIENAAGVRQIITIDECGHIAMRPMTPPHACDCGRRYFSADRVRDCVNTRHGKKPL